MHYFVKLFLQLFQGDHIIVVQYGLDITRRHDCCEVLWNVLQRLLTILCAIKASDVETINRYKM